MALILLLRSYESIKYRSCGEGVLEFSVFDGHCSGKETIFTKRNEC